MQILHRGPCSFHKLNSNEKVLSGTIQLSHAFALRAFSFLEFKHEVLRLLYTMGMQQSQLGPAGKQPATARRDLAGQATDSNSAAAEQR